MNVKIFTVTKNESDLIDDFVTYHGSIFGYTNIILIDNDSDCPIVLDLYNNFRKKGVIIEHCGSYQGNSQGEAFTTYMRRHRKYCNFMIGLDTDEFIQLPDFLSQNPLKCNMENLKEKFSAYFKSLPKKATKFVVKTYFSSVPDPSDKSYIDQKISRPAREITHFQQVPAVPKKCFFRSETFVSTVNGCHNGRTSKGKELVSDLSYVHFHNTGARRSVERARSIVSGYGYTDVDSALQTQLVDLSNNSTTVGSHRVLEYAIFLSKMISISELIKMNRWPSSPEHLLEMAISFPSMYGFNSLENNTIELPRNWEDLFDSTVFYDAPVTKNSIKSSTIRNLLGTCSIYPPGKTCAPPKIALMLSGHMRNFSKRKEYWKELKKLYTFVDIFVHTWSENGERGRKEWVNVGSTVGGHEDVKDTLNPVGMLVEDHKKLFDSFSFKEDNVDLYYTNFPHVKTSQDFTKYIGSQLYSVKKCFDLTQASGKNYDLYMRLRGDAVIENFGTLLRNNLDFLTEDTIVINGSSSHAHPGGGRGCRNCDIEYGGVRKHKVHCNDVCDIFYFGRKHSMSKLCNMYSSAKELVTTFREHNANAVKNPRVKKHLKKFGYVTVVSCPMVYENDIKAFYPERLIREFMKEFWLISDVLGLVPKIKY